MRKKINVQGFRPGKAPRKMIEKMYGAEVFFEEAINNAFPEAYESAVKEQELRVVGYPEVEMVGECTKDGFTFKATVPVYPEVTLGQYKGLSAPKDEVKVTAADVDERLKQLSDRNTRLVSVDREAKEGDTAVIDFEGFLDGKAFEGGKGENHSLELGSHSFVPGFEEQVIGMKAGDEKDIDITFPEDYHADLAGKAVVFMVKVHEVKEKEVPALDDEFAKDVSEFDTLKDLKADLKKKITEERQKAADRAFEDTLMEQVGANITADIPDAMIENQARQFLDNFKMQIAQQGIPYDQYMKMTGMEESKLLEDAKEPATDRNTRLVSVDREAKEGDTAVIDFEGFLDGKAFEGGKGENHSLELGSHSFVPGFEEQVIGMKAGDEKDIDITFPEDYHADLAGKAVVFMVKVHEVKEKEVPALDDEFAKDVSEFDTLKDLKADLKKKITEERQKAADRAFEDTLMEQVGANITADIPDAMIENQARQFLDNFKMQIAQQGIPYDQYMKMTGMEESKLLEDAKEPATRQVRLDLALAAIIEAEKIEVTDEDVEAEMKKMAEQYNMELETVKKYLQAEQVKDQLMTQKAIAIVVDSATAVKPEKKTAKKKADDAAEGEEKPAKKTTRKTAKKAEQEGEKEAE